MSSSSSVQDQSTTSSVQEQSTKKMISLRSSDGQRFDLEENVAMLSTTLKNCIEEHCAGDFIPVANVNANNLIIIIEYCKIHTSDQVEESCKKEFDEELVKKDLPTMIDLLKAANYMDIPGLIDLLAKGIADQIKIMKIEQVREVFGIENDLTPEEEEAMRQENAWAYHDDV